MIKVENVAPDELPNIPTRQSNLEMVRKSVQKCTQNFTRKKQLAFSARPFDCTTCHHRFRCRSALEIHMRIHTGERPYECKVCGKQFVQKGNLNMHSLIHAKEMRSSEYSSKHLNIHASKTTQHN